MSVGKIKRLQEGFLSLLFVVGGLPIRFVMIGVSDEFLE